MNKIVVASMRKSAGKTSVIVGLTEALKKKVGYMKPFGDRMVYKDKKLRDYDVELMTDLYGLEDKSEDMCFGFDHSKLKYVYKGNTRKRLLEAVKTVGKSKDLLVMEGANDLMHGTYLHLGSLSLAKHTGAKLVVVVSGSNDHIVDDAAFLKKYLDRAKVDFGGIIINKVRDLKDFKKNSLPELKELGVNIIGILPYQKELTHFTVGYLAEALNAKVITGDVECDECVIKDILIGAMSVDAPLQKILAERKDKLVITAGDRTDMILASLASDTEAIVLTNGILPPSNIISKVEEKGVPMLLVPHDTYKTAKMVDTLEPLMTKGEDSRRKLLGSLVKKNLDLKKLF